MYMLGKVYMFPTHEPSVETQAILQKNTEEMGVDKVKQQINLFFKTPFDQLKKL